MKSYFYFLVFLLLPFCLQAQVTTGSLLEEMSNLRRLSEQEGPRYRTVQYSSYDRSSSSPSEPGWFANGDGFGSEKIPSFSKVLQEPDTPGGKGRYLICDVRQPGALVRLWTARIGGEIRLFLDGASKPVFEGKSEDFFWKFIDKFSAGQDYQGTLRQVDAVYFPIAFQKGCRIEWTGSLKETHFYHVNLRLYDKGTRVKTFKPEDLKTYASTFEKTISALRQPETAAMNLAQKVTTQVPVNTRKEIFKATGAQAIEGFSIKLPGQRDEFAYRQSILHIYFDDASVAQVQSPIGDFFAAAPGVNPFQSLPMEVAADGTMTCRFPMPFSKSVRVEVENLSGKPLDMELAVNLRPYNWVAGKSMYFHAHWRVNHEVTATNRLHPQDIPYVMAFGEGRVVGAATYLFNNGNIPSAGGSWWGEGDEKIFVDADRFPSFFGTGSEDYYNYSWSSNKIFAFPFCGQPRNDGPANRGFVTNYRWHVVDDIPFHDKLSFSMELIHHEVLLPGFSYARMVYLYAKPGYLNDLMHITAEDVRRIATPAWEPAARNRTTGYHFVQAEALNPTGQNLSVHAHYVWSQGKLVMWEPARSGEELRLRLPAFNTKTNVDVTLTLAQLPGGGKVSAFYKGKPIKLGGQTVLDLSSPHRYMLESYKTERIAMEPGAELVLKFVGEPGQNKVGIDFIWLRD